LDVQSVLQTHFDMLKAVERIAGSSKRKTTDEELHEVKEVLAKRYEEKFK